MSALPPKADINWRVGDVRLVPKADMTRQRKTPEHPRSFDVYMLLLTISQRYQHRLAFIVTAHNLLAVA